VNAIVKSAPFAAVEHCFKSSNVNGDLEYLHAVMADVQSGMPLAEAEAKWRLQVMKKAKGTMKYRWVVDEAHASMAKSDKTISLLAYAPPQSGKTTLLVEMAFILSNLNITPIIVMRGMNQDFQQFRNRWNDFEEKMRNCGAPGLEKLLFGRPTLLREMSDTEVINSFKHHGTSQMICALGIDTHIARLATFVTSQKYDPNTMGHYAVLHDEADLAVATMRHELND
jgi:hypothetical protein